MAKPRQTVFYSWQSDSPPKSNRNFIQDALDKAVKALAAKGNIAVDPVIDRDTRDVAGAPSSGNETHRLPGRAGGRGRRNADPSPAKPPRMSGIPKMLFSAAGALDAPDERKFDPEHVTEEE